MSVRRLHALHERRFAENRFVYPVLSRRAGGLSIGVNLNPDKTCNFDCIYCQVDRRTQSETRFVETERLLDELDRIITLVLSGSLYETDKFRGLDPDSRRLCDIAFSGDGEPTTYKNFDEIVEACAALKRRRRLDDVQLVLITNASMLHRPHVQRGLDLLDRNNGRIWAKLEAGTEPYWRRVERTPIPMQRVLDNITAAAQKRPLVIQSLFMRIDGQPPPPAELEAFCDRLNDITNAGGRLSLVQVYTVARPPAERNVTPLSDGEVDAIVELVRRRTGQEAAGFYGVAEDP